MFLNTLKEQYEYIVVDCSPSLGMLTINALVAADSVIIPVQASFLATKGLEALLETISNVKMEINPKINIDGILITMFDARTNLARDIAGFITDSYGNHIRIYKSYIPMSVKAGETTVAGKSIHTYNKNGKIAESYMNLAREVIKNG
jgi:chromosome partitioning protein